MFSVLYSVSCTVLVDEFSLVALSFLYYYSLRSFLFCLQSTSNPLKAVLRVSTREHLVEQFSFLVVM
jgi:hypothetical protein